MRPESEKFIKSGLGYLDIHKLNMPKIKVIPEGGAFAEGESEDYCSEDDDDPDDEQLNFDILGVVDVASPFHVPMLRLLKKHCKVDYELSFKVAEKRAL